MIKRHITHLVKKSLTQFPAVLLNGARQAGKSTLAEQLVADGAIGSYITLDDLTHLEAAKKDPQGFIEQFSASVAIDEIQRAPELLLAVKKSIDSNKMLGKFLLTGSANVLSYPNMGDSLAGRVDIISLENLSLGEIAKKESPSQFINDAFNADTTDALVQEWSRKLEASTKIDNTLLSEALFFGGFPDIALRKDQDFRNRWLASYMTSYVERDIRDLSKFLDIVAFAKLLRVTGLRTGNLLNNKNLSSDLELDQRTVARYLELLEISFQIKLLKPWSSNMGKRYVKTSKIFMADAGLASFFFGISNINNVLIHPNLGQLVETWVFAELRKLLSLCSGVEIYFYRNHQGVEVDFLVVKGNKTIGIECKSGFSVSSRDCKNLRFVSQEIGDNFIGIVLYRGDKVVKVDNNIIALPFDILTTA